MQLHQSLNNAGVAAPLIAVSFATNATMQQWKTRVLFSEAPAELFAQTRFVSDPEFLIYQAYGLGRNSAMKVYGARVLMRRAWLFARGKPRPTIDEDTLQRGGDFVISGRIVRFAYASKDQGDRPPFEQMIAALRVLETA